MKVNEKEYPGVAHFTRGPLPEGQVLVIAWFDGEPDLYICDVLIGVANVKKMYDDEWGEGRVDTIQIFTEVATTA